MIALCLLGLMTAFVPNYLYMRFAPQIGANAATAASSIELPMMFIVGWIAFAEPITFTQTIAGLIILMAISLSSARRVRNVATNVAITRRKKP